MLSTTLALKNIGDVTPFIIAYLRVSTLEQADTGLSLQSQENACIKETERLGGKLIEICTDPGVSGALYYSREGIQNALKKVEALKKEFPHRRVLLMMMHLDRSGREVDVIQKIRKRVVDAGAELCFTDGMQFANNAGGKLMFNIMASVAQNVRDVICENTMDGRRERAASGINPSRTRVPFGYHIVTKADVLRETFGDAPEGTYIVMETHAAIIREIFGRFADGDTSLRGMANELTHRNVATPDACKAWSHSTIRKMLQNPAYKGAATWGKTAVIHNEERLTEGFKRPYHIVSIPVSTGRIIEIPCPALVSETVWAAAQKTLAGNRERLSGTPHQTYLFSGLLRCPACGGALNGTTRNANSQRNKTGAPILQYRCATAHNCRQNKENSDRLCTHGAEYKTPIFDALFVSALVAFAEQPERVVKAIRAFRLTEGERLKSAPNKTHEATRRFEIIAEKLAALGRKESATIDAQIEGVLAGADPAPYRARIAQIAQERAALSAEQIDLRSQAGTSTAQNLQTDYHAEWTEARHLAERAQMVSEVLTATEIPTSEKRGELSKLARGGMQAVPDGKDALRLYIALPDKVYTVSQSRVHLVVHVGLNQAPKIEVRAASQSNAQAGRGRP